MKQIPSWLKCYTLHTFAFPGAEVGGGLLDVTFSSVEDHTTSGSLFAGATTNEEQPLKAENAARIRSRARIFTLFSSKFL